jgi:hypothetical protein
MEVIFSYKLKRKEDLKNYRNNEYNLRNFVENEDERKKETENYFNDLKISNYSTVNILNKEKNNKNFRYY